MTCRLWWSSLVVCCWISIFRCSFSQPLELLGLLPWAASRCSFPATPSETCCLLSTLENTLLVFGLFWTLSHLHFPAAPWTDSESSCGFPRILETSGPKQRGLPSVQGLLKSNTLTPTLLPQVLLPSFLEFSSTWCSPFQLNEKRLRENIERSIKFTKRSLLHSWRVKLPSLTKSASCFLVSTCVIWILGSKLILSNNQSDMDVKLNDSTMEYKLLPIWRYENVAQHLWWDHFSFCVSWNDSKVHQSFARILTIMYCLVASFPDEVDPISVSEIASSHNVGIWTWALYLWMFNELPHLSLFLANAHVVPVYWQNFQTSVSPLVSVTEFTGGQVPLKLFDEQEYGLQTSHLEYDSHLYLAHILEQPFFTKSFWFCVVTPST